MNSTWNIQFYCEKHQGPSHTWKKKKHLKSYIEKVWPEGICLVDIAGLLESKNDKETETADEIFRSLSDSSGFDHFKSKT